jgi:hypothetical protein
MGRGGEQIKSGIRGGMMFSTARSGQARLKQNTNLRLSVQEAFANDGIDAESFLDNALTALRVLGVNHTLELLNGFTTPQLKAYSATHNLWRAAFKALTTRLFECGEIAEAVTASSGQGATRAHDWLGVTSPDNFDSRLVKAVADRATVLTETKTVKKRVTATVLRPNALMESLTAACEAEAHKIIAQSCMNDAATVYRNLSVPLVKNASVSTGWLELVAVLFKPAPEGALTQETKTVLRNLLTEVREKHQRRGLYS